MLLKAKKRNQQEHICNFLKRNQKRLKTLLVKLQPLMSLLKKYFLNKQSLVNKQNEFVFSKLQELNLLEILSDKSKINLT